MIKVNKVIITFGDWHTSVMFQSFNGTTIKNMPSTEIGIIGKAEHGLGHACLYERLIQPIGVVLSLSYSGLHT